MEKPSYKVIIARKEDDVQVAEEYFAKIEWAKEYVIEWNHNHTSTYAVDDGWWY